MKKLALLIVLTSILACGSTQEESSPFTFTEQEISEFKHGYLNKDASIFPFVLVVETSPNGSIIIEKPTTRNLHLLRSYGVVYIAILNEDGYVTDKKLIAGQRNMRGNNAVYINQVIAKTPFAKASKKGKREVVIPIALTYPLETY